MNRDMCEREAEVLAAVDGQAWNAGLRAHVDGCPTCRDVEIVAVSMLAAAREEIDEPLPDAGRLWWRAQIDARREARQRSMRPLDAVDRAEPFIAIIVTAFLLLFRGDHIASALSHLLPDGSNGLAVQAVLPGPVVAVLVGGLLLTGVMLLVGLSAAFSRD